MDNRLPILNISDQLRQTLAEQSCVVVTAAPGAGKSTMLPLLLPREGKILMLEPRRLAARQIAERMASLLGENVGETVGYRIRFESRVSAKTRIEVLTEGILTRMLIDDPTLDGVSMVIFDEFHERSLHSDVALALTREAQQVIRPDLKIILMSATIDATAICRALGATHLHSEGRMFPVEIRHVAENAGAPLTDLIIHTTREAHRQHEGDILVFLPGEAEIRRCQEILESSTDPDWADTHICPLYGMLSQSEQNRAIAPSLEGERKVVLATPIAETSLTIEGVRVVIDSGLCRQMVFDPQNGLSHLETVRISLDMANQRSGRAGRVAEGICYRLWSLATEHRMAENREPEILSADLAPIILDIAAWGEIHAERLPWITPPPTAHLSQAARLLEMLDAFDRDKGITSHGRKLAQLPCHPRVAEMLLQSANEEETALAADIAALLDERDPMTSAENDADINTRLLSLRESRRQHREGRQWNRISQISAQYRRLMKVQESNVPIPPMTTGRLLAAAYPERIAKALDNQPGAFRTASGDNVTLPLADSLSAYPWIAIASLNAGSGRVFLASPIDAADLKHWARPHTNLSWDSRQGRIIAQQEERLGQLLLESKPISNLPQELLHKTLCEAAHKEGTSMLDFGDEGLQNLQRRVAAVAGWHPELELPDLSTEAVLARTEEWLPLYLGKATNLSELKKIPVAQALWGLLSYDQQLAVDRLAPTHISVPTGSRIRVEYRQGAELPILRVRLQECFGLLDTPRVDDGKRPILMELLSPGFKPVQLTQDLRSFWQGTYFEVRKELRRRYPKHSWPENPLEAEPTRRTARPLSSSPSK